MKLRSLILSIIQIPYALLLPLQFFASQTIKVIHDQVFRKEREQKYKQEDARNQQNQKLTQQTTELQTKLDALQEGQKEINELLQRGHTFLGFNEVKKAPVLMDGEPFILFAGKSMKPTSG